MRNNPGIQTTWILIPYKELFDIPYDMPYGKTLTDEQSIQFPLCIAAAIHCRYIVVYYKYVIGHYWLPVSWYMAERLKQILELLLDLCQEYITN